MRRRTLSLSRPRTHVLTRPLQHTQDLCWHAELGTVCTFHNPSRWKAVAVGVCCYTGRQMFPTRWRALEEACGIITTAQALCMIHFRIHAIPSFTTCRGESLMSGTWVGLDSFSAAGSDARAQLILLTLRCAMCTGIRLLPNFVPLSPHFSAMSESSSFYFKSLSRCQAPYVNSKFCVRLTHNRHRKKGFNSTCERVTAACNSVARF